MSHPKTRAERRSQRARILQRHKRTILNHRSSSQNNRFFYTKKLPFKFRVRIVYFWSYYLGKFAKHKPFDRGKSKCFFYWTTKNLHRKQRRLKNKKLLRDEFYTS